MDYFGDFDLESFINEYAVFIGFFLCFVFLLIVTWYDVKNETLEEKIKWGKEMIGNFFALMILAVLLSNQHTGALLHMLMLFK